MITRSIANISTTRLLAHSGLFDSDWYTSYYPDLAGLSEDQALSHYVRFGAGENRDPSPLFHTGFYLNQFSGLNPQRVNPLAHYIVVGESAGAWPNAWFDPIHVEAHLGAPRGPRSALAAYVSLGSTSLSPSTRFDSASYLSAHPAVRAAGLNPLWHYAFVQSGLLSPLRQVANSLVCQGMVDLAFIGMQSGRSFLRVTGNDPYLVLQRLGGKRIDPGHYRLQFQFTGQPEGLTRAKIYLDTGDGFSEAGSRAVHFEPTSTGLFSADVSLDDPVKSVRFDPLDSSEGQDTIIGFGPISLRPVSRARHYNRLAARIAPSLSDRVRLVTSLCATTLRAGPGAAAAQLRARELAIRGQRAPMAAARVSYYNWIEQFDTLTQNDRSAMAKMIETFAVRPLISIVMPVYNTPEHLLCECIDSVLAQTYPDWELCIADDKSPSPQVRDVLTRYMQRDPRIKVVFREENGHISKASNSALELATGDWIALLDHDDLLAPHALFCVAETINRNPDARLIYSDEDKIDLQGNRADPYFKSDWNERLFFEQNMVSHLGVFRHDLVKRVGGFRQGFEGAQDYDLVLRLAEHVRHDQIVHIPHVLYHWRAVPGSTALASSEKSYAVIAGAKALEEALARRGVAGSIDIHASLGHYRLRLEPPNPAPLVSIIIPTRDGLQFLEPCIRSLLQKTTYPNYEILIVDNQSAKPETHAFFDSLRANPKIRVLPYDDVFNYSAINNFAVRESAGSLVCLLNNDTEVITGEWLTELVAEVSQDGVGAAGAKLLYEDGAVQHAGVILGVGAERGVAGHGLLGVEGNAGGYFNYGLLAREVSAATAACLVIRREAFEAASGLNEPTLRVAFNDVDLCLKIREAGYRIVWSPYALLYHYESKSRGSEDTPEKQLRFQREVSYMLEKWDTILQQDPYYNPNLALNAETYSLSRAPRVKRPWMSTTEELDRAR